MEPLEELARETLVELARTSLRRRNRIPISPSRSNRRSRRIQTSPSEFLGNFRGNSRGNSLVNSRGNLDSPCNSRLIRINRRSRTSRKIRHNLRTLGLRTRS